MCSAQEVHDRKSSRLTKPERTLPHQAEPLVKRCVTYTSSRSTTYRAMPFFIMIRLVAEDASKCQIDMVVVRCAQGKIKSHLGAACASSKRKQNGHETCGERHKTCTVEKAPGRNADGMVSLICSWICIVCVIHASASSRSSSSYYVQPRPIVYKIVPKPKVVLMERT